jgi:hypothetical protein
MVRHAHVNDATQALDKGFGVAAASAGKFTVVGMLKKFSF